MTEKNRPFGEVFDAHTAAEFQTRDVEATMATMGANPHVTHVPVMTGGHGTDAVRNFYDTWFIGHWPDDAKITLVSRTVGESQLVDELILSFTHDCEMPAILPDIKPTGRKVVVPTVVIVGFDQNSNITHEHIYWDQASMLVQLGLLDKRAARNRRRAGGAAARSQASLQYADPEIAEARMEGLGVLLVVVAVFVANLPA